MRWKARISAPGTYRIILNCMVPPGQAGSKYVVEVRATETGGGLGRVNKNTALVRMTEETGGGYKDVTAGEVKIAEAGPIEVVLRPTRIAHDEFLKLRSMTLQPAIH